MEAEETEAQMQPVLSKFWQHSVSSSDDDSNSSSSDSDSESDSDNSENEDENKNNDERGADGAPRRGFWGGSSDSSDSSDSDSDSDAELRRGKGRSVFLKKTNDSSSDDSSSDDSDDDDDDESRSNKSKWQIKKKLQKQRQAKFRQRQQQNLAAAAAAGEVESVDSESDSEYTRYICDGCDTGIHSVRWHSTAVDDFDLCQSCYGSSTLTTSHGPFEPFAVEASHYEVQTFIGGNIMPSPWPPAVFERGGLGSWRLWLRHQVRCQAASAPAPAALSAACCL